MEELSLQRNYKDTLFRRLFQEKSDLLSLYNALNGSNYDNPDDLTVNTLENTIYMSMKNDISFLIDDFLNLYEAQSTWNPNMPLRDLFYLSNLYKGYIEENHLDIYSSSQLYLPTPKCVVFYNGLRDMADRKIVKLSDSFTHASDQAPALECNVTYLNINYGHNREIMEQCQTLNEYAFLIDQIRKQLSHGKQLASAIDLAVKYCIENNVLADFLAKHRAEVTDMILAEYNAEEHIKNEKEISFQDGLEIGIKVIIELYVKKELSLSELRTLLSKEFNLTEEKTTHYLKKYNIV